MLERLHLALWANQERERAAQLAKEEKKQRQRFEAKAIAETTTNQT